MSGCGALVAGASVGVFSSLVGTAGVAMGRLVGRAVALAIAVPRSAFGSGESAFGVAVIKLLVVLPDLSGWVEVRVGVRLLAGGCEAALAIGRSPSRLGVAVAVGWLAVGGAGGSAGARIATGMTPAPTSVARLSCSAASAACRFGGGISGNALISQAR